MPFLSIQSSFYRAISALTQPCEVQLRPDAAFSGMEGVRGHPERPGTQLPQMQNFRWEALSTDNPFSEMLLPRTSWQSKGQDNGIL